MDNGMGRGWDGGGKGGGRDGLDWTGLVWTTGLLDSLGVHLSRVEGWYEVPIAMASFLPLEHLIRLLREPHKPFTEVLHPRVCVILWSVIVL